ncbi:MAG TPA: hypothetical protein VEP49_17550 [Acidimicrobiia bacterium]|nr:hypothetical protein [Acidimicrobiia bacterium]
MTVENVDARLARLHAASDTIGANLLDLDRDPNLKRLETAALTGETATRWSDAARALAGIWRCFTQLLDLLERATALRGPRPRVPPDRVNELTAMLTGPSIELVGDDIPLGRRDLLGDRQATTRCTPDELLTTMSAQFDQVLAVVVAAGAAWDTLLPRLEAGRRALSDVASADAALGSEAEAELGELSARADRLDHALATDPVAVRAADLDTFDADLAQLGARVDAARHLRDEFVDRLADARATMDGVRTAARTAAEAHQEVRLKIATSDVPIPAAFDRELAAELDEVVALGERGQWTAAQDALDAWRVRASESLRASNECEAANRAPIEARNELRGRLDAYYAMAHDVGMLEDPGATRCYERAHAVLYTAPTDLADAIELVREYQQRLAVRRPEDEEPEEEEEEPERSRARRSGTAERSRPEKEETERSRARRSGTAERSRPEEEEPR